MRRFITATRKSLEDGNPQAALFMALCMPDICGSLIMPGAKNGDRYKKFCTEWLTAIVPRYITAEEMWALRNSLLHAGSDDLKEGLDISGFVFFEGLTVPPLVRQSGTIANGRMEAPTVVVSVEKFCNDILNGVDGWLASADGKSANIFAQPSLISLHKAPKTVAGFIKVHAAS